MQPLSKALLQGPVTIATPPSAALAYAIARENFAQRLVVIVPDEDRAQQLVTDLAAIGVDDVVFFK